MTHKFDRAPLILAFAADQQGCGYHRIVRPLEVMSRNHVAAGRVEVSSLNEAHIAAFKPDVLVFQRQYEDAQREQIKRLREALPDAFFVFEIDDIMSAVPDSSWHKPFVPSNVDAKIAEALKLMDAASTTTSPLADHLESLCPGLDVRIVPNMLGRDDFEMAAQVRSSVRQSREMFRVGWGGGIGHSGDLRLLEDAIRTLEVCWVFFGTKPDYIDDIPDVRYEFYPGVRPQQYISGLAALDLDLMLAPLEDNLFNKCKSNLRLIEAGACNNAIIASPVDPYFTKAPPVFAYPRAEEEWTAEIRRFMSLPIQERIGWGNRMHTWASSNFCLDDHVRERLAGWLPSRAKLFTPKPRRLSNGRTVLACKNASPEVKKMGRVFSTIEEAIEKGSGDILYVRPGSIFSPDFFDRLDNLVADNVATISFPTNDAVPQGFPRKNGFSPVLSTTATKIDGVCALLTTVPPPEMPSCAGPAILLRREALDAHGKPFFENDSDEGIEFGLVEWSAMCHARRWRNLVFPGAYVAAEKPLAANVELLQKTAIRVQLRWPTGPIDDSLLDNLRETLEIAVHRDGILETPVESATDYPLWAYSFDTCSQKSLEKAEIYAQTLGSEEIIAVSSVDQIRGDRNFWLLHVSPGAVVAKHALAVIRQHISGSTSGQVMFYADHDYLDQGRRVAPDFKPNLDRYLLLGRDYITQFCAIRADVAAELIGDVDTSMPLDCIFYELALRTIETFGRSAIGHIPRILCSMPFDAVAAGNSESNIFRERSAQAHAMRTGLTAKATAVAQVHVWRDVSFVPQGPLPSVSIIIPTTNRVDLLEPCINTLLSKTRYPNFDVHIVQNGGISPEMQAYLDTITDARVIKHVWATEGFNWSKLNNDAVRKAKGDFLVFLNDDTRVLEPAWLSEMVGAAQQMNIGAVGAKLVYPSDYIQHIGVTVNSGACGHMHKGIPVTHPGYQGIAMLAHEATAVTGACMLVRRWVFDDIGGFDENYAHNFNDVAFCLELRRRGYINLVAPKAVLQHYEGVSRLSPLAVEGRSIQTDEGQRLGEQYPEPDPYWNPNLAFYLIQGGQFIVGTNMDLMKWPPEPFPWAERAKEPERILCLGPKDAVIEEVRDGALVFEIAVFGHIAKVERPIMENLKPFDMRNPADACRRFNMLGINKIVVSSIGDMHPDHLMWLVRFGLPIEYRPIHAEAVCPRQTLERDGAFCDRGWTRGACQNCIDQHGSPHGFVGIVPWYSAWMRFFQDPNVEINTSLISGSPYEQALHEVMTAAAQGSLTAVAQ